MACFAAGSDGLKRPNFIMYCNVWHPALFIDSEFQNASLDHHKRGESMKNTAVFTGILTCILGFGSGAIAGDLEWSGTYRIEGLHITTLSCRQTTEKSNMVCITWY